MSRTKYISSAYKEVDLKPGEATGRKRKEKKEKRWGIAADLKKHREKNGKKGNKGMKSCQWKKCSRLTDQSQGLCFFHASLYSSRNTLQYGKFD